MEGRRYYVCVDESVYGNWRAIGVLEDLTTDEDVASFLVTLYSSGKKREGEESSLRCVDCHCPLTLYCSTCHRPSHLTLPPQPPPPSLSSPPPPPPPQVPSAPASVPTHTDHSPQQHAVVIDVKDEGDTDDSPQDGGGSDCDDCPVDFGSAKQDSLPTACDSEPTTASTDSTASSTLCAGLGRRKCRKDGSGKDAQTSDLGKRKKRTTTMNSTGARKSKERKVLKKNQCMTDNMETDSYVEDSYVEGVQKTRENNIVVLRMADLMCVATQECANLSENVSKDVTNKPLENLTEGQKTKEVCESKNLDEGFVIPVEERHSALIHTFDDSFFKQHKIEDKPPQYTRQKASEKKHQLIKKEASKPHSDVEDCVSSPRRESNAEAADFNEANKHSLRILVSDKKIPPLKTADGSYTRTLYSHFECLFCKKAFIHKRTFNRHIQTHVEENLYKCTMCYKGFARPFILREHEKKHKFDCNICGKKCTEKSDYNDHMKLHTENNGVMKCPGCAYQSTDFYLYRKHKYECAYLRPALQCEICGVHLKSVKSLKHHIAAIHRNDRPYQCALCEKSFVFKTKLTCHMKYYHAEGGRLFHCDKCGHRFIDAKGLKSHQKSVHSDEKPFKCTHCPSAFARKYTLAVHLRLHTGEKPFRCTQCLQAFVQKPSLLLHLRSHHGHKAAKVNKPVEAELSCS